MLTKNWSDENRRYGRYATAYIYGSANNGRISNNKYAIGHNIIKKKAQPTKYHVPDRKYSHH